MRVSVRAFLSACAAAAMTWSCSKSTEPSTNTITVSPSTSVTLHALNDNLQLSATLLDKNGTPVSGTTFSWSSSNTAVATVVASSGLVTSKTNGTTTITVSGGGVSKPIALTVAQSAATQLKLGDNQIGNQGAALGQNIVVVLSDSNGNPVIGATVAFAVATGGGSVTPTSAISDGSGNARTAWTLGSGSNIQTATATVSGLSPATFTGNSIPAPAPGFQIVVINVGPSFSPAVQAAFDSAVAFWQRAIVGDLPDISGFSLTAGSCGNTSTIGPLTVDDVIILAKFDSIDGAGKILGQAGPCGFQRGAGTAPAVSGAMIFDTADVASLIASGSLNAVIRHEMGHVLGFGTFGWTPGGCGLQNASLGSVLDTDFNCAKAVAYFDSLGGTTYTGGNKVPVENCGLGSPAGCGTGTVNSHWRYTVFGSQTGVGQPSELMIGYLQTGAKVSKITLAAMADWGYTVNFAAAEPYAHTFTAPPVNPSSVLAPTTIDLGNDILHFPLRRLGTNAVISP